MSYVFDSFEKNEGLPKKTYLLLPTLKFDGLPVELEISTPDLAEKNGIVKIRVFAISTLLALKYIKVA